VITNSVPLALDPPCPCPCPCPCPSGWMSIFDHPRIAAFSLQILIDYKL